MDMIQVEIARARGMLDRLASGNTDVEEYRVLDSLWQVVYLMWLETTGVIRSPYEQKAVQVTAEQLAEMAKRGTGLKSETSVVNTEVSGKKKDGYL